MTKPEKRRGRFLLIVGIAVLAGSLSATSASAAPQAGRDTPVAEAPHVIAPSYYITPAGKRLSVAEFHAAATTQAAAGSLPVFYVTAAGFLQGIHTCAQIGKPAYGDTGIECTDLFASSYEGVVAVQPAGEAGCQNEVDGVYYNDQCANVTFKFEVANTISPGDTITAVSPTMYCGHTHGNCVNDDRNLFGSSSAISTTGCDKTPGEGNEFWDVVLAGTTIELPGDVNVTATSNLASQHAIVCP